MENRKKISIIGNLGIVGSAIHANLKDVNTVCYDKYFEVLTEKNYKLMEDADAVFICVPVDTKSNGELDLHNIHDVLNVLHNKNYRGLVIIKSTIDYKNLHLLQQGSYKMKIVYNPEFLQDITAIEDFKNQEYIVFGGRSTDCIESRDLFKEIFEFNCEACTDEWKEVKYELCSFEQASMFKYLRNFKQSLNVIFWEAVHDMTWDNSRMINEMMKQLPVSDNATVGLDGFRGYGGKCLPKDNSRLSTFTNNRLVKNIIDYNISLAKHNS
jgi:UDP-glucose 6-dehydrogenase